jgi:hypothetical protein
MSSEAHVAQLQDLLERVQRNRLRLAELRSSAGAEAPAPEAPPVAEVAAPPEPEPPESAPILPVPTPPATELKPVEPEPEPEPEPELVPLPDEPVIAVSEPFEEITLTSPIPLVAEVTSPFPLVAEAPAPQPDLSPRRFEGEVVASGPVAEVAGTRVVQRSWSLDAVLFRAWRLGREGGSR